MIKGNGSTLCRALNLCLPVELMQKIWKIILSSDKIICCGGGSWMVKGDLVKSGRI